MGCMDDGEAGPALWMRAEWSSGERVDVLTEGGVHGTAQQPIFGERRLVIEPGCSTGQREEVGEVRPLRPAPVAGRIKAWV